MEERAVRSLDSEVRHSMEALERLVLSPCAAVRRFPPLEVGSGKAGAMPLLFAAAALLLRTMPSAR